MGLAIGQPLQDVSETVLKKINSKSIKSGMRKYNPDKCKPYNVVKTQKRLNLSPNRGDDEDGHDYGDLSKEVIMFLNELSCGASSKMSLIKMQIVKADENCSIYSRIANFLRNANI